MSDEYNESMIWQAFFVGISIGFVIGAFTICIFGT